MTGKIFLLILIFFLIGGAGVWRICVKKPGEKKRLLLKYFTYFFIVSGVCSLFAFTEEKTWLASFLVAAGTMEILFAWVHSGVKRNVILFLGIFIFGLVSVFFIRGIILLNSFFLLRLYVIVLSFDGFSQVCGQLFGAKKITPGISPNKTLAGVLGGSLIAIATGMFLFHDEVKNILLEFALTFFIVAASFAGDILASLYKRKCGVKDYSNVLPGHGGILDRFDSFIFAVAVTGLILQSTGFF